MPPKKEVAKSENVVLMDDRTMFYDKVTFTKRAYKGTKEVFTYLNKPEYKAGCFPVIVEDSLRVNKYYIMMDGALWSLGKKVN